MPPRGVIKTMSSIINLIETYSQTLKLIYIYNNKIIHLGRLLDNSK